MLKSIFRYHFMILSGLMLIMASNAQARLRDLQAGQAPSFLDIVRNGGSVTRMTQYEAVKYCANQGAHLPSARELAQLSMSLGARGIVDSCGSDDRCYRIRATNADGSQDEFYFSYTGYQRPAGDLGNNWFWSSSVDSSGPDYAFVLSGFYGDVDFDNRVILNAVRCVSGR